MGPELNRWSWYCTVCTYLVTKYMYGLLCSHPFSVYGLSFETVKKYPMTKFFLALSFVLSALWGRKGDLSKIQPFRKVLGMHFLSARLQSRLLQWPEIHRNPCRLSKLYYICCLSNNCDINSMWFYFAFRAVSKENVQWHMDMYRLSGITHSNINLQIGQ